MDKYAQLERINALKEKWILTEEEYQNEKKKILLDKVVTSKVKENESSLDEWDSTSNRETINSVQSKNNMISNIKSTSWNDIKESISLLLEAIDDNIFSILFFLIFASWIYVNWWILSWMNAKELGWGITEILTFSGGVWLVIAWIYFLIVNIRSAWNTKLVRITRMIVWILFCLFMIIWMFFANKTSNIGNQKQLPDTKKVSNEIKEIEGNSRDITNSTSKKSLQSYIDEWSMHVTLSQPMAGTDSYSMSKEERTKLAIDIIEEGLVNYPNSSELYSLKADIFNYRYKQYDDALKLYNKAISIDKTNTDAYIWKITLLMSLNKFDDARETFEVINKIDPNNSSLEIYRTMLKTNK